MSNGYCEDLIQKFTSRSAEDQVQQVKKWIEDVPHNDEIIPAGEFCRAEHFVDLLTHNDLKFLCLAYAEKTQDQIAELLSRMSEAALMKNLRTKDDSALQTAIRFGSLAAYHVSLDCENRGIIISMFGRILLFQSQKSPSEKLLNQSIDIIRKSIDLGPPDGRNRALHFHDLGQQLCQRFMISHNLGDFNEAESCFQTALALQPSGKPIFSFSLAKLRKERDKFDSIDKKELITSYIEIVSEAVKDIPKDFKFHIYRESLSQLYHQLGMAYHERYNITKTTQDWTNACDSLRKAKSAQQHGNLDKFRASADLGRSLVIQFRNDGRIETADEAESNLKEALEVDPENTGTLEQLGYLLNLRASHTGSEHLLTESVRLLNRSVELSTSPSATLLVRNAAALAGRFEQSRDRKDIDRAIDLLFCALLEACPLNDDDRAEDHTLLTNALIRRFKCFEDYEDLDIATAVIEEGEIIETSKIIKGECFRTHGNLLFTKYKARKRLEDLKQAIEYYRRALELPGTDLHNAYNDLGNAFLIKYEITGAPEDLSASAYQYETALASLRASRYADSKNTEAMLLQGLANTQYVQFAISEKLSDINIAIECYEKCLVLAPPNHYIRVSRTENLALAYQKRSDLTESIDDMRKSQELLQDILDSGMALSATEICNIHNLLGTTYLRSYRDGQLSYLDLAIDHFKKSLASGCKIPSYIHTASVNLARTYRLRATETNSAVDMTAALQQFSSSVTKMQGGQDPQFEITFFNLAELLISVIHNPQLFTSNGASFQTMRKNLVQQFIEMSKSFSKLRTIPRSSIAWLLLNTAIIQYTSGMQPVHSLKMIEAAAEELPGAILQSLSRTEQLRNIRKLNAIPSLAIVFSLLTGKSAQNALLLFEKSRSILWDHVLAAKPDEQSLDKLKAYPELEAKYAAVNTQLSRRETLNELSMLDSKVLSGQKQFDQALSYNRVLDEIRSKPELRDFLRLPSDEVNLQRIASDGPIVVVNGCVIRSDAIIIRSNGTFSIPLPLFTFEAYKAMREELAEAVLLINVDPERGNGMMSGVLKSLWRSVARPILDFLGLQGQNGVHGELPRVWWLSTGWIGNLPIHAAGDHKTALETRAPCTVIDRVVSSYATNVRVLDHLRHRQKTNSRLAVGSRSSSSSSNGANATSELSTERRALLVKMPKTKHMPDGDLPYASAETSAIERILTDSSSIRSMLLDRPKCETVLQLATGADMVHFACHGVCSERDPADSALRLADWENRPLSVTELLNLPSGSNCDGDAGGKEDLRRCQLVYLSACETALNRDRRLDDEGLHLAGGFQMAGVPHVVASAWHVDDVVSVDVATAFYTSLASKGGGVDVARSAFAVHTAVMKMRAKGVDALLWAAYLHFGP
jgi:tetratricopeptide (TPR) repeat protein